MATPLTAAQVLAALRAEGVKVVEYKSWRTHNRAGHGAWGPVNGVMIHHTVTSGTDSSVALCYNGHASLPGPLCHGVIDKQGVVHMVGWGRANHAGGGDGRVLDQVMNESYGSAPSRPTKGNANGTDGNARFYGFECINLGDGKDPWPTAQLDAIERVAAALCRAHDWGAKSVIGHLEWSSDKVDPRGFSMPGMRDRIAARLKKPAGSTDTDSKEPTLSDMTAAQVHAAVWGRDAIPSPTTVSTHKTNPTWKAESFLPEIVDRLARLTDAVAALTEKVDALPKKVS